MTKQKANHLKTKALNELQAFLNHKIIADPKKATTLSYWIYDYVQFLKRESTFEPEKLSKYRRGDIIKAHLGFRIGSEEGGLHYCVVIDKNNTRKTPTVTVIPLTSVKPSTDIAKLPEDRVFLGNEIYQKLTEKIKSNVLRCLEQVSKLAANMTPDNLPEMSDDDMKSALDSAESVIQSTLSSELSSIKKLTGELEKMKTGSIALIGQITTISKLRIYDPKNQFGVLHKIRLSDNSLDLIDQAIAKKFTK